jgi:signal transduction histidine kinase/ligand-binding sensor domain-containing protein
MLMRTLPGLVRQYLHFLPCLAVFTALLTPGKNCLCQEQFHVTPLQVTTYSVEQGLNQSMVKQVCQDSRGLVWVVTGDGLQYLDGAEFRTFRAPFDSSFSSLDNTMREIVEVSPGQFIISTSSSILHFNSHNGTFTAPVHKGIQYPRLLSILLDNQPLCWIPGGGLYKAGTDRLTAISIAYADGATPPAGFLPFRAERTRYHTIVIAGKEGYIEIEEGNPYDTVLNASWRAIDNGCTSITADREGNIYFLSDGAIYSLLPDGTMKVIHSTGLKNAEYLFSDREGHFWISDKVNKRLFLLDPGTLSELRITAREGRNTDTLHPIVTNIFEDKCGNIWLCSDGNGLLLYSPGRVLPDRAQIGFTRCIRQFNGSIWAGTLHSGLWKLSPDLSVKQRINPESLGNDLYFFDLFVDGSGRLWTITNKGVFVLNALGHVVFRYPFETSSGYFMAVSNGKLLLSTYSKLYSCSTGNNAAVSGGTTQTQVRALINFQGKFWIGNQFGLFRTDTSNGISTGLQFRKQDRLSPVPVYSILPLDGEVWVATEAGITCYSPAGVMKKQHAFERELKEGIVYSLLADKEGRIWFSGSKGIGCITRGKENIIYFGLQNNLQSAEFNYNASCITQEGRIYFGGIRGINGFDTRNFNPVRPGPAVCLLSLQVSDTAWTKGIPADSLAIAISRNAAHLSGEVFSPGYEASFGLNYSFFLEGYQQQWSKPVSSPAFSYRNLPPGSYRLWARCSDSYQNQGASRYILSVTIEPPFWNTWWFPVLVALSLVAVTILVVRKFNEIKYRRRLKDLEHRNAIDRERLRISQDMHDEVGASLTQISILGELARKEDNNPGETLRLVDQISSIAGAVVDEMSGIIWAMNPRNDTLTSFASYLRQHASEYLESAGVEGRFTFDDEFPAVPMTSEQRRNIWLVAKEALHNIVKHSGAGIVDLRLSWTGGALVICVSDNGIGFDIESQGGRGNGLGNMKKRMGELGACFSISSTPGKGTCIEVVIALSRGVKPHEKVMD